MNAAGVHIVNGNLRSARQLTIDLKRELPHMWSAQVLIEDVQRLVRLGRQDRRRWNSRLSGRTEGIDAKVRQSRGCVGSVSGCDEIVRLRDAIKAQRGQDRVLADAVEEDSVASPNDSFRSRLALCARGPCKADAGCPIHVVVDIVLGFVAQSGIQRKVRSDAPVVLYEAAEVELTNLLVGAAGAQAELARATTFGDEGLHRHACRELPDGLLIHVERSALRIDARANLAAELRLRRTERPRAVEVAG